MQRDALFDLLGRLPSAVTVVTPNQRLARALAADFDAYQTGRSLEVWETPKILPFSAFVASLNDSAQHDPAVPAVPTLLTKAQEHSLWEAVVADSGLSLLDSATAADLAADAWTRAHQWDVAPAVRSYTSATDTRIFISWASEYQRRLARAGATDLARLPDAVREYLNAGVVAAPPNIVLAGFDETTAQQQRVFDALIACGARSERLESPQFDATPQRAICLDARDENQKMADWVAARLVANPDARIGRSEE